jgi:hypothetical protein
MEDSAKKSRGAFLFPAFATFMYGVVVVFFSSIGTAKKKVSVLQKKKR